jgi:hypothetical protein
MDYCFGMIVGMPDFACLSADWDIRFRIYFLIWLFNVFISKIIWAFPADRSGPGYSLQLLSADRSASGVSTAIPNANYVNVNFIFSLCAKSAISSFLANCSTQLSGIRSKPYKSPAKPPVTAPVVSVSSPKLTAFNTAAG